jgi:fimbrial chaperone protein
MVSLLKNTGRWLFYALCIVFLFEGIAVGAGLDIQPIKIYLDARSRIDKLTVKNVSDDDLSLQVRVFTWSQNANGRDQYEETTDIIIFPKIMKVLKGEEKFIRVGTNLTPLGDERTYRIYIEEIPVERPKPEEGATVRMTMKIGVPVFISPLKSDPKGAIQSFSMSNGKPIIEVKNTGNIHFIITSLNIKGTNDKDREIFSKELGGWYVLNGASRTYETSIPAEVCNELAKIHIAVKTDRLSMNETFSINKGMCNAAK